MNIWQRLPRPFVALAPMDDVTDMVFRDMVADAAPPDIFFTEFASADGLQSPGRDEVELKLRAGRSRPLVAQIWGKNPEAFLITAQELAARGFDGIDLNFGCPVAKVIKNGCCSALLHDRSLAQELIAATKEGAGTTPVSVKTRIGFYEIDTESWCGWLLEQNLDALIVHGRTVAEQSRAPAHWNEIGRVVRMRDASTPSTVIVGNGDVRNRPHAEELAHQSGVDGVMIGRGVLKDLNCFAKTPRPLSRQESLAVFKDHVQRFEQTWGEQKPFEVLKKFAKLYVAGWEGAARERDYIMQSKNARDMLERITTLLHSQPSSATV